MGMYGEEHEVISNQDSALVERARALVNEWDGTIQAAGSTRVPWAQQLAMLTERIAAFAAEVAEELAHAHAEIDKLAPTVLALEEAQIRFKAREARLRERSLLYNEAVTILLECDHGDEQTCGCRDRAMERLAAIKRGALTEPAK